MANDNLKKAKAAKNDEFYTQYPDIQKEVNAYLEFDPDVFKDKTILLPCDDPEWSNFTKFFAQNFETFKLKKLISTSYAVDSKQKDFQGYYEPSWFETESPQYDESKTRSKGKIFTLDREKNKKIDFKDLKWNYLKGDGDFRSDEVKKLRDEADIIITNPPFSLFREFVAWILEANKKFLIIGNMNASAGKEFFPYIKNNKLWLGNNTPKEFIQPDKTIKKFGNILWYTNLEHGRRHEKLQLMTMDDNLQFNKKVIKKGGYIHYDNLDAIDIPSVDAIPSDYAGVMGVPISLLDKYNPEQFELLGIGTGDSGKALGIKKNYRGRTDLAYTIDGKSACPFNRILIRHKK